MAKKEKEESKYKIINMRQLAKAADMDYQKLYFNLTARYDSITDREKTELCNALYKELRCLSDFLEIDIILKRSKRSK
jgi:hypothetical protein